MSNQTGVSCMQATAFTPVLSLWPYFLFVGSIPNKADHVVQGTKLRTWNVDLLLLLKICFYVLNFKNFHNYRKHGYLQT